MSPVGHQASVERATRRLGVLFALVSATTVLGVSVIALFGGHLLLGLDLDRSRGLPAGVLAGASAAVFGGAWRETARLHEDGALIARRLGAVALDTVADPLHRRLQHLLEELSIAARIGVPRAFVLEDVPTINALTAGMDPERAVVVVTRGALARLTRDELQGVLAHEIAHLVSGDVRLNTWLLGLNHGLRWVGLSGRRLIAEGAGLERRPRWWSSTGPSRLVTLAGVVLVVLGGVGDLAARLIQAAVGREREFLADAQAVALTHRSDGLGSALRKVAGQAEARLRQAADPPLAGVWFGALRHAYLRDVAHLLLVRSEPPGRWFDTHPPLSERVQRLHGGAMSPIAPRELPEPECDEPDLPALAIDPPWASDPSGGADGLGATARAAVTRCVQASREPAGAAALIVALAGGSDPPEPQWETGWACAAPRLAALRLALAGLPRDAVRALAWPLTELAVARLRPLSRPAREALFATVRGVALVGERPMPRAFIYLGLLRRRLLLEPLPRSPGPAARADAHSIRVLFAVVAHSAQISEAKADRAANAAIRALDLDPIGGSAGPLTAASVAQAMRAAAALRPLARPVLVRQLAALLPDDASQEVCDLLRLLCVAIDAPPPPPPPHRPLRRPLSVDAGEPPGVAKAGAATMTRGRPRDLREPA